MSEPNIHDGYLRYGHLHAKLKEAEVKIEKAKKALRYRHQIVIKEDWHYMRYLIDNVIRRAEEELK